MPTEKPTAQGAKREPVTRERIFAKALEMVDAEGCEALSMRRLARELGVEAMALYHHVPNKEAILDGVVEVAIMTSGQPGQDANGAWLTDDWAENLVRGGVWFRDAMLAHPHVMPLITDRTLKGSPMLGMYEGPLYTLAQAGFEGQALLDAYHAYFAYVFGWSALAVGVERAKFTPNAALEVPDAFPMTRALGSSLNDWSQGFESGLRTLLKGLESENVAGPPTALNPPLRPESTA